MNSFLLFSKMHSKAKHRLGTASNFVFVFLARETNGNLDATLDFLIGCQKPN